MSGILDVSLALCQNIQQRIISLFTIAVALDQSQLQLGSSLVELVVPSPIFFPPRYFGCHSCTHYQCQCLMHTNHWCQTNRSRKDPLYIDNEGYGSLSNHYSQDAVEPLPLKKHKEDADKLSEPE
jgi:hypothetical protein